jgi:hypothetical protein
MLAAWFDSSLSTIGDLANMIAALAAAIGLLFTAWSLRVANFQRRVRIVSDAVSFLYAEPDISDIYYKIDYSNFKYNPDEFLGSTEERKLDHLLARLNVLAKQYQIGLIRTKDLDIIRYEYLMVFENEEVQKYLNHLDDWFKTKKLATPPFHNFRQLGKILSKRSPVEAKAEPPTNK